MQGGIPTSVPNAPVRRMDRNDRAIVNASKWNATNQTSFRLGDRVTLADSRAVFLQGLVSYVGRVHFAEGIHVGVQLTGPSVGRGHCDGAFKGRKYFSSVGKNNGVIAHVSKVSKPKVVNDPAQTIQSEGTCQAELEFIDCLVECRTLAILRMDEEKKKSSFQKQQTHIVRLKQLRYEELLRAKGLKIPEFDDQSNGLAKNKYAGPSSVLAPHDYELAEGLELTQQNFCLSDPSLPDNPIVYASQAFLNMSGYELNEILGRNCRFLQGEDTDKYHVYRVRKTIQEGSDCHVCLLNFRKDGSPFYNRLFMTALRDKKGRIKNYLGVQTEVTKEMAIRINAEEKRKFEQQLETAKFGERKATSDADETESISASSEEVEERLGNYPSRQTASEIVVPPKHSEYSAPQPLVDYSEHSTSSYDTQVTCNTRCNNTDQNENEGNASRRSESESNQTCSSSDKRGSGQSKYQYQGSLEIIGTERRSYELVTEDSPNRPASCTSTSSTASQSSFHSSTSESSSDTEIMRFCKQATQRRQVQELAQHRVIHQKNSGGPYVGERSRLLPPLPRSHEPRPQTDYPSDNDASYQNMQGFEASGSKVYEARPRALRHYSGGISGRRAPSPMENFSAEAFHNSGATNLYESDLPHDEYEHGLYQMQQGCYPNDRGVSHHPRFDGHMHAAPTNYYIPAQPVIPPSYANRGRQVTNAPAMPSQYHYQSGRVHLEEQPAVPMIAYGAESSAFQSTPTLTTPPTHYKSNKGHIRTTQRSMDRRLSL